jgi:hypothetical protein
MKPASPKRGWLIAGKSERSLKKRYVVLSEGILSYFAEQLPEPPFGAGIKGQLSLRDTSQECVFAKGHESKIVVSFEEWNVFFDAKTSENAAEWLESINSHREYALSIAPVALSGNSSSSSASTSSETDATASDSTAATAAASMSRRKSNDAARSNSLLTARFTDSGFLLLGMLNGVCIYETEPTLKEIAYKSLPMASISHIEMMSGTNTLAVVGTGRHERYPSNKVCT